MKYSCRLNSPFFYHPCYILLQPKAAILSTHCGADSGSLHHLITFYKLLKVVFYTLCMSWSYKSTLKNEWFYIPFCSPFFLNRGEYEFYIKNKWCIISFKMVCVGFIDFYRGLDWTSFVRNFSHIFLFSAKKHICWKANLLHILLKIMGKFLVAYINCHPISRFSKVSRERVTLACRPCTLYSDQILDF